VNKRLRVGEKALTAGLFYHHAEAPFFVFVASFTQPIAGLLLESRDVAIYSHRSYGSDVGDSPTAVLVAAA
jgi:hypothetical protein